MSIYSKYIMNSDALLFLGAGASKPLGKLLMAEFIDHLFSEFDKMYGRSTTFREIIKTLNEYRKKDLETVLQELNDLTNKDYLAETNKINAIVNLLDDERNKKLRQAATPIDSSFIPSAFAIRYKNFIATCNIIRREIEKVIFAHYGDLNKEDVVTLYQPFLNFIRENNKQEILPIFTTNYDSAIETLIFEKPDYNLVDGFEIQKQRNPIWKRATFDTFQPSPNVLNIPLFKLHGSVTWYEKDGKICYFNIPMHKLGNEKVRNVLIYPTNNKISTDDPFYTAYDYFQRCLDKTKLAIFVGYSFRDYDTLTKIKSALRYNENLKIAIIDKSADVYKKKLFASNPRVTPIKCGFEAENRKYYITELQKTFEAL